jgi:hypothetical protein
MSVVLENKNIKKVKKINTFGCGVRGVKYEFTPAHTHTLTQSVREKQKR